MIEGQASGAKTPKLHYGMVGGGQGAFIGDVHRKAIAMDGKAELVCGAVEWFQETPNTARLSLLDRPTATLSRGRDPMSPRAQALSRIPSGHPEGYFEGFANIYSTYTTALAKKLRREPLTADDLDFPTVDDGLRGVRYIEACVESSAMGSVWVNMGT